MLKCIFQCLANCSATRVRKELPAGDSSWVVLGEYDGGGDGGVEAGGAVSFNIGSRSDSVAFSDSVN
jgi:hypothetical protein